MLLISFHHEYLRRTGRTGRAGRTGVNIIMVCPGPEERELAQLESEYTFTADRVTVPNALTVADTAGAEVR